MYSKVPNTVLIFLVFALVSVKFTRVLHSFIYVLSNVSKYELRSFISTVHKKLLTLGLSLNRL